MVGGVASVHSMTSRAMTPIVTASATTMSSREYGGTTMSGSDSNSNELPVNAPSATWRPPFVESVMITMKLPSKPSPRLPVTSARISSWTVQLAVSETPVASAVGAAEATSSSAPSIATGPRRADNRDVRFIPTPSFVRAVPVVHGRLAWEEGGSEGPPSKVRMTTLLGGPMAPQRRVTSAGELHQGFDAELRRLAGGT